MAVFDPTDTRDSIPAEDQPHYRYPENSHMGKMLRHWNKPKSQGGMNADGFEKFPMMLHRAQRTDDGRWVTSMPEPEYIGFRNEADYGRACQRVLRFNETCQKIVSAEEYERILSNGEGWRDTPKEALAYREQLETEISDAAAERLMKDKKMSHAAQAEAREVDASTDDHVAEIPRKVGRPRKPIAAA